MPIDQRDHPIDERLALEIAHLPQCQFAAEMIVAVRVAAGAAKRTLAGDFDGQGGRVSRENSAPDCQYTLQVT